MTQLPDRDYLNQLYDVEDLDDLPPAIISEVEGPVSDETMTAADYEEKLANIVYVEPEISDMPDSYPKQTPLPRFLWDCLGTLVIASFLGPIGWIAAGIILTIQVQNRWN